MDRQKWIQAFCWTAFVWTALGFLSPGAQGETRAADARTASESSDPDPALEVARHELLGAARAYNVGIEAERIAYVNDGKTTIVHAPILGAKHRDADFAAGVPILLITVHSTAKLNVPEGSYLVKAQYRRGDSSGQALFLNRDGKVAARRPLLVRTWKQSGILFPDVYTNPEPAEIPNITSTHILFWDAHGNPHYYVDCSGMNGVLYFEM